MNNDQNDILNVDKVHSIIEEFIKIQISTALSYVEYKYSVNPSTIDIEQIINRSLPDFFKTTVFDDFLPAYLWGAIDAIYAWRGETPTAALPSVFACMIKLYGDRGVDVSESVFKSLSIDGHPDANVNNSLRVSGADGIYKYLSSVMKPEGSEEKLSDSDMFLGESSSFNVYLVENHEEFLLGLLSAQA